MKTVTLPSGERVPAFGQGTWCLGDDVATRAEEIATIHLGLDFGLRLIDTAEMYGEGRSEELIGEAIRGRRDDVFLVSKVYPHNASRRGILSACARSLRRLGTDRIDLYLLHWRGDLPLSETLEGFAELQASGKIRHYGVSNLDLADMDELWAIPGGSAVATDQVLYNLTRRGIEWDLLPWLRKRGVPVMAYSPIEQGRLARNAGLEKFASRNGMTPVQAGLAWLMVNDDIIVIPKTRHRGHLKENLAALDVRLTKSQLEELDGLFPRPPTPGPLEML